jgi:pilus assembly protein Flp/PilA
VGGRRIQALEKTARFFEQNTNTNKPNIKTEGELKMKKLINFFKDEEGATMVEYGLMVALIAVVCLTTIALIGTDLNAMFVKVDAKLK